MKNTAPARDSLQLFTGSVDSGPLLSARLTDPGRKEGPLLFSLRQLSDRIQGRAVRRAGELLKQFNGKGHNQHTEHYEGALITQKHAADAAGMSDHQRVQAVRVANVPAEKFEAPIEAEKPATVTALARNRSAHGVYWRDEQISPRHLFHQTHR
jgi:hypothetical protein